MLRCQRSPRPPHRLQCRLRIVFHAHHSESVVAPRRMYIGTMEFKGNVPRMAADPIIHP